VKGYFSDFRVLCSYVRDGHTKKGDAPVTTYQQSVFPDETLKIPCPNGCGELFVTHMKAAQHGRRIECPSRKDARALVDCPYKAYLPCNQDPFKGADAPANRTRSHVNDSRAPTLCSKGCVQHYARLYMLGVHEEKCSATGAIPRATTA
jgi:hypothetical protein